MITVISIVSPEIQELAFAIRVKVFVEEQGVDASLEYEYEEESHHFIAYWNGEPAGTARWRTTDKGIKLERFAVLADYRGKKIGAALLEKILQDTGSEPYLYLHAQEQAADFYKRFGFLAEGDPFYEAGIRHYKMSRRH